jgi:hypothetical protein
MIEHVAFADRFLLEVDGHRCVLDYELIDGVLSIQSTRVPAAVSGRGIAASLTRAALNWAQTEGYAVRPLCSYAAKYIQTHPEYTELLRG